MITNDACNNVGNMCEKTGGKSFPTAKFPSRFKYKVKQTKSKRLLISWSNSLSCLHISLEKILRVHLRQFEMLQGFKEIVKSIECTAHKIKVQLNHDRACRPP
jgi:hypothetical protein